MLIPVYISRNMVRGKSGTVVPFPERRLVSLSGQDPVIAVLEAPEGSKIRSRKDVHGSDQLIVPLTQSWWTRVFGTKKAIPAKYVISFAKSRLFGLSVVSSQLSECEG